MKTRFNLISLLAAVALLAIGCSTPTPTTPVTPARVETAVRLAGYLGSRALLIKNPEMRPALLKTRDGLRDLVAARHWDVATAAAIAAQNGVGELVGPDGTLWITSGAMLLELLTGESVDLARNEYARAAVEGLMEGLEIALGKD